MARWQLLAFSTSLRRELAAVLLSAALCACGGRKAVEGHGLLPSAPAGQTKAIGPPPKAVFDQALANSAFARTVFQASGPSNLQVTVRDVIIGPHGTVILPATWAPMLLDPVSGTGSAGAGQNTSEVAPYHAITFRAGSAVSVKNTGEAPLVMRLYSFEGK
jgi:hypothetical protein